LDPEERDASDEDFAATSVLHARDASSRASDNDKVSGAIRVLLSPFPKRDRRDVTEKLFRFWRVDSLKQLAARLRKNPAFGGESRHLAYSLGPDSPAGIMLVHGLSPATSKESPRFPAQNTHSVSPSSSSARAPKNPLTTHTCGPELPP